MTLISMDPDPVLIGQHISAVPVTGQSTQFSPPGGADWNPGLQTGPEERGNPYRLGAEGNTAKFMQNELCLWCFFLCNVFIGPTEAQLQEQGSGLGRNRGRTGTLPCLHK